ncbi:MAG: glycosyltransferase family 4 protein [Patescibacteria group bacterium]
MKIAIIGAKGVPATYGGVERHAEELALGLVSRGHDVTVYSRKWYTKYDGSEYKGIKIKNIGSIKTKNFDTISHVFLSTLDAVRGKFDVIHYQGVGPALLSFIPRILSPKTKVFVTFHCEDFKHDKWSGFAKFMLKTGEKAACTFPHKTITVSKLLKYKVDNFYDSKAEYIPNGITVKENLSITREPGDIFEKFNIEPGKYIVAVTRLVRHKGVHLLIDAYKNMDAELKNKYKLVIVGGGTFGDKYEDELKEMSASDSNIVMTGMQSGSDLEKLFIGAKIFSHASSAEGLPITVLEAMNYEKPVVVSDIPEHMEVVGEDKGISFKTGDVNDLKQKLEFALNDANQTFMNEMLSKAKNLVKNEYNWDKVIEKTELAYREVIDANKAIEKVRI